MLRAAGAFAVGLFGLMFMVTSSRLARIRQESVHRTARNGSNHVPETYVRGLFFIVGLVLLAAGVTTGIVSLA